MKEHLVSPEYEIDCMYRTYDLREVHRRDLLVVHIIKVDVPEERMLLDVLGISLACS
jgi:hypothetical protein